MTTHVRLSSCMSLFYSFVHSI